MKLNLLSWISKVNEIELIIMPRYLTVWTGGPLLFIWCISIYQLKYLDKLIKCLELRAKIKSVQKIHEIFLCIFKYIWKLDIFSTYLNFDKKWFFCYFKSQISKCHKHIKLLTPVLYHKNPSVQNNKLLLYHIHYLTPCTSEMLIWP